MALPLIMLRHLQMSRSAKIGLAGIFGVGIITIVFDIVRTVETMTNTSLGSTALWTNLESTVAIMVSCMPSYRALLGGSRRVTGNSRPRKQRTSLRAESGSGEISSNRLTSLKITDRSSDDSVQVLVNIPHI